MRPGTDVLIRETPPARSAPTDTGVWFVAGLAEKGPTSPVLITSMAEYAEFFGVRVSYGLLYDALDAFFHEGGNRAYVQRVLGPAAVSASRNLLDAGAAITLVATALNPGDWANDVDIAVVAGVGGGTFVLVIREGAVEVERSPDLADQAAAIAWSQSSDYIRLTAGASSNDPAVAAAALLTGGTDDRASITDTHWLVALDKFEKELGPGQVSYPGRTTGTAHTQLLAHAAANRRIALLDFPDTSSKTTLIAAAAAITANGRWGAAFAPWAIIPGVAPGTTRTVPYSAVEAGIMARNDVSYPANVPAAGELGANRYSIGLSQPKWNQSDIEDLNEAGVNVVRYVYGEIRTYGFRTLADPVLESNWLMLGGSREVMSVAAQGEEILERFVFDQIDGRGLLFSQLDGELTAMLQTEYAANALYGATPGEAFHVDVGSTVNTPASIAAGELRAVVSIRTSPMAEYVVMELVKVPVTQAVA
jgi:phage tail sheath protein FI